MTVNGDLIYAGYYPKYPGLLHDRDLILPLPCVIEIALLAHIREVGGWCSSLGLSTVSTVSRNDDINHIWQVYGRGVIGFS